MPAPAAGKLVSEGGGLGDGLLTGKCPTSCLGLGIGALPKRCPCLLLCPLEDGSLREVRCGPAPGLFAHDGGSPEEPGGLLRPPDGRGERCQIGEGGGNIFPDLGIPSELQAFPVHCCRVTVVARLAGKQAEVAKRN
jgi:hypothetical protein